MKTNSRLWLYVVPALVLILALGYAFAPRPLAVETAQVTRGSLRETVDEEGRTRIKERYVLSAPLNGQLRRIELHPGDCVEAGKTLVAVIEPTEPELLDPRSRAQAEARLRTADAQFALTTPRADRVRATLELALAELTRAEKLFEQHAISIQDLDHARETARAAAEDL
jgi:HlyD family secretion protein